MQNARILLSTLNEPLVVFHNTENIILSGFTVEAGLNDGVVVTGGKNNRVENCDVVNVRRTGIFVNGGVEHRVTGCDIHEIGIHGLVLNGGDRKTLTPASPHSIGQPHLAVLASGSHGGFMASGLKA